MIHIIGIQHYNVIKNFRFFYNKIIIPVSVNVKTLDELSELVNSFKIKKLTFAISKYRNRFCLWRERELKENIIIDYTKTKLNNRNFIRIWYKGKLVFPRIKIVE